MLFNNKFHNIFISNWLKSNQLESPLLVGCVDDIQRSKIAEEIALEGFCKKDNNYCGKCHDCHLIKIQSHPDVVFLTSDTKTISIATIREWLSVLSRTSQSVRVAILPDIERLSLPAANALLKALEEPSAALRYVLTCSAPGILLPTIKSRCIHLHIPAENKKVASFDISKSKLALIKGMKDNNKLKTDEIVTIGHSLGQLLRDRGPDRVTLRAFMRLRDLCKVSVLKGNEKLAHEVLYLSLPE